MQQLVSNLIPFPNQQSTAYGYRDPSDIKWCKLITKEPGRNRDGRHFLGYPSD